MIRIKIMCNLEKENIRTRDELELLNYEIEVLNDKFDRMNDKFDRFDYNFSEYFQRETKYIGEALTTFTYQKLMLAVGNQNYSSLRLRMMICILALTGIQIQQLRSLKVSQLESFLYSSYDHLSTEGHRVWEDRKKDLEYLLSAKDSTSYCFTAKSRPNRPLARESITRDINKVLKKVSQKHLEGSKLTSYSFRTGYINQLWKTPEGLKLVKELLTSTEPKTAKSIKEKY